MERMSSAATQCGQRQLFSELVGSLLSHDVGANSSRQNQAHKRPSVHGANAAPQLYLAVH